MVQYIKQSSSVKTEFFLTDQETGQIRSVTNEGENTWVDTNTRESVILSARQVVDKEPWRVFIGQTIVVTLLDSTVESDLNSVAPIPPYARAANVTLAGGVVQFTSDGTAAGNSPFNTTPGSVTSFNLLCRAQLNDFRASLVDPTSPAQLIISYTNLEFESVDLQIVAIPTAATTTPTTSTTGTATQREAIGDPQAFLIPALDEALASTLPAIPATAQAASIFLVGADGATEVTTARSVRWTVAATGTLLPSATVANPSGGGLAIALGFNNAVQGETINVNTADELAKLKLCTNQNGQQMVGLIQYFTAPETVIALVADASSATGTTTANQIATTSFKGTATNAEAIKASAGSLFALIVSNDSANPLYIHLFDSTAAPAAGSTTSITGGLPVYQASAGNPGNTIIEATLFGVEGLAFSLGMSYGISTSRDQFTPPIGTPCRVFARLR